MNGTNRRIEPSPREHPEGNVWPLVLIVEDHSDTRALYRYMLEASSYRVVDAVDGAAALDLVDQLSPNLILMDANLPDMDGLMTTRRIRQLAGGHSVPIIFISGNAHPQLRIDALSAGGNEYLIKPINLDELEVIVERLLTQSTQAQSTLTPRSYP